MAIFLLLAILVVFIANSYVKARYRIHQVDKLRSQRAVATGLGRVPTWAGTREKNEAFVYGIQNVAVHRGVPQVFLTAILNDSDTFEALVHYAGSMEEEGASFTEQQMAVSERLIEIWDEAPEAVRTIAQDS